MFTKSSFAFWARERGTTLPTLDLWCFCTYPGVGKKFQPKKRFKGRNGHFSKNTCAGEERSLPWHVSSAVIIFSRHLKTAWKGETFKEHSPLLLKKHTKRCMWALRKHRSHWVWRLRNIKSSLQSKIKKQQQITKTNETAEPVPGPSNNPFHPQYPCQIKETMKMIESGGTFLWILGNREDNYYLEENKVSEHNQGQPLPRILVIKGQSYKLKMVPLTQYNL